MREYRQYQQISVYHGQNKYHHIRIMALRSTCRRSYGRHETMATFDADALWTTLPDSVKGTIRSYICHPVAQLIHNYDAHREAAPPLRELVRRCDRCRHVDGLMSEYRQEFIYLFARQDPRAMGYERIMHGLLQELRGNRAAIQRLRARLRLCAFKGPVTLHAQKLNGELHTINVIFAERPRIDL